METIHLSFSQSALAYTFVVFWLATYSGGLRHNSIYLMRTAMVSAYALFVASADQSRCTLIEYVAQCLIMCSWIGVTAYLFKPGMRWRNERAR
jgi:hypothetical protein